MYLHLWMISILTCWYIVLKTLPKLTISSIHHHSYILTYHTATLIYSVFLCSDEYPFINGNIVRDFTGHPPNFLVINKLSVVRNMQWDY